MYAARYQEADITLGGFKIPKNVNWLFEFCYYALTSVNVLFLSFKEKGPFHDFYFWKQNSFV